MNSLVLFTTNKTSITFLSRSPKVHQIILRFFPFKFHSIIPSTTKVYQFDANFYLAVLETTRVDVVDINTFFEYIKKIKRAGNIVEKRAVKDFILLLEYYDFIYSTFNRRLIVLPADFSQFNEIKLLKKLNYTLRLTLVEFFSFTYDHITRKNESFNYSTQVFFPHKFIHKDLPYKFGTVSYLYSRVYLEGYDNLSYIIYTLLRKLNIDIVDAREFDELMPIVEKQIQPKREELRLLQKQEMEEKEKKEYPRLFKKREKLRLLKKREKEGILLLDINKKDELPVVELPIIEKEKAPISIETALSEVRIKAANARMNIDKAVSDISIDILNSFKYNLVIYNSYLALFHILYRAGRKKCDEQSTNLTDDFHLFYENELVFLVDNIDENDPVFDTNTVKRLIKYLALSIKKLRVMEKKKIPEKIHYVLGRWADKRYTNIITNIFNYYRSKKYHYGKPGPYDHKTIYYSHEIPIPYNNPPNVKVVEIPCEDTIKEEERYERYRADFMRVDLRYAAPDRLAFDYKGRHFSDEEYIGNMKDPASEYSKFLLQQARPKVKLRDNPYYSLLSTIYGIKPAPYNYVSKLKFDDKELLCLLLSDIEHVNPCIMHMRQVLDESIKLWATQFYLVHTVISNASKSPPPVFSFLYPRIDIKHTVNPEELNNYIKVLLANFYRVYKESCMQLDEKMPELKKTLRHQQEVRSLGALLIQNNITIPDPKELALIITHNKQYYLRKIPINFCDNLLEDYTITMENPNQLTTDDLKLMLGLYLHHTVDFKRIIQENRQKEKLLIIQQALKKGKDILDARQVTKDKIKNQKSIDELVKRAQRKVKLLQKPQHLRNKEIENDMKNNQKKYPDIIIIPPFKWY